jgi:hypothetical protein
MSSLHVPTAKLVAALCALSLALVAAGPASAKPNGGGSGGKQSCRVNTKSGIQFYPHGSKMSVRWDTGKTDTYKCNDGRWEAVHAFTPTHGRYQISQSSGYLVSMP